ncbi:MAG: adenine deaminase [Clostridia bacterium]|nr:adenine deaminase [Clostridia bacterium]
MKKLLKNAMVVNVFTDELERADVLIEDGKIIGVGDYYTDKDADVAEDLSGKVICPGFIDGHIHIESSFLTPYEFARACVPHGTTTVIADCHEIANVCGADGINYMIEASRGLPLDVYFAIPSCVPATDFDEAGARLEAADIEPFFSNPCVVGLGEVMNYVGVIYNDQRVLDKVNCALWNDLTVNGHAPLVSGKELDKYVSAGIRDDHECSTLEEAKERIRKGQKVMIRQGTAARNLQMLLPLFEEPWSRHCMLVCDDKHPADITSNGHIDEIIRLAVRGGKSPIVAIRMATIQAAQHFALNNIGAVAPSYQADLVVLDGLDTLRVCDVYKNGKRVYENGKMHDFPTPQIDPRLDRIVRNSFHIDELKKEDFIINETGKRMCRVIKLVENQLLTDELITEIDFDKDNGIDISRDILKLAVLERHNNTGHKGVGFINGISMEYGAIAASVSHDSHNLIVIGTNEDDMVAVANRIRELGGGMAAAYKGEVIAEMPLPIAGIMTDAPADIAAQQNEAVRESVYSLGADDFVAPFMTMAFVSLPVIPHLKMTTNGLFDVDKFRPVPLIVD